jgi:hypothetical protein
MWVLYKCESIFKHWPWVFSLTKTRVAWTSSIIIRGYILTFTTSDFVMRPLPGPQELPDVLELFLLGDRAGVTGYCGVAPSMLGGLDKGTIRAGDSRKPDIYGAWLWLASFQGA